ncbi:MAG: hypothetical protein P4L84_07260 [Isosphaeraceae bacterium]|nr:hypothetical protein [Isosphaeraceae bacterium]
MLKPLTLSLSLAVALGACSMSMAGGHHTYASAQAPCAAPSAQCATPCGDVCAPKKKCALFTGFGDFCGGLKSLCTPKPKCYTYTWVLKKKRVWGCHSSSPCGAPTCETCGVYPSGQGYAAPSGQAAYAAPTYGAGQTASIIPTPAPAIATAPTGDEAPPAPELPSASGPQSSLLFSTTPSGN